MTADHAATFPVVIGDLKTCSDYRNRLFVFLRKRGRVEDQHAVFFSNLFSDLLDQFVEDGFIIPIALANENL